MMKKTVGALAAFAVIAPTALLNAQLAQAGPFDPVVTTTVMAPSPRDYSPPARQEPAFTIPQRAPAYTPPTQAYTPPPAPAYTPAYTPPAVTTEAPQTQAPVITPDLPTATRQAPTTRVTQEPTTTLAPTTVARPTLSPTTEPTAAQTTAPQIETAVPTSAPEASSVLPTIPAPTTSTETHTTQATTSNPIATITNTPQTETTEAPSTSLKPTTVITDGTTTAAVVPVSQTPTVTPTSGVPIIPSAAPIPVKDSAVVEAAKRAPASIVDPVTPPAPPTNVTNINTQVNNITQVNIQSNTNVTVNNWRPNRWNYVDYDPYRRPIFYNPCGWDMRYHYYYQGGYRDVWVPAGGRIILNITVVGVFPFTAVGGDYVSSGYFDGGGYQPTYYDNAYVNVVAVNRPIFVQRVTVIGHDDTRPVGQQDSFMLDGTTLAQGQIQDGKINLATSQLVPGVGPTTNGVDLVNLAADSAPAPDDTIWYAGGALALAALMGGVFWRVWGGRHHYDEAAVTGPIDTSRYP